MGITNLAIIIGLILFAMGSIIWFFKKVISDSKTLDIADASTSLENLEESVVDAISATIRQQLKDLDITEEEMKSREALKRELRRAQYLASHGDTKEKVFLKKEIARIITDSRNRFHVTERTIDNVIPFEVEGMLKVREKFEILLYVYSNYEMKQYVDDNGDVKTEPYGADGFAKMIEDYDLAAPIPKLDADGNQMYAVDGSPEFIEYYDISADKIEDVYSDKMQGVELTYKDKVEILSQRIFEDKYGFGPVDMLFETSLDDVSGGLSGIPANTYDIKTRDTQNAPYSYESIWVTASGKKIHVSALTFGTQDELIRVTQNIYKYETRTVLSKKDAGVVSTMKNGARVTVFRPPFAATYGFIVRKFDSAPSISPSMLITDRGNDIPIVVAKWLTKSSMFNIAITGEQGSGKTTWLKSIVRFIREDLAIRTMELTRELNLNFTYPFRNIVSFVETDSISSQDGLDFLKKTSGDVTIVGEVASAAAASWVIQTAKVASRMTMFTHHAKTWQDLVVAIRNNVIETAGFNNEKTVDQMVADSINIDIHFEVIPAIQHRYIERINYIFPVADEPYPYEIKRGETLSSTEAAMNEHEFRKRLTDRKVFDAVEMVRFDTKNGRYKFLGIDPKVEDRIKRNLNNAEWSQYKADINRLTEIERELARHDLPEEY